MLRTNLADINTVAILVGFHLEPIEIATGLKKKMKKCKRFINMRKQKIQLTVVEPLIWERTPTSLAPNPIDRRLPVNMEA